MFHPNTKSLPTAAIAALAVLFAGHPGMAQDEPRGEVFRDVTEVNVVNVEVVVTDKQGRPVAGLTRDDFELRENGKPVTISNFYAIESGSPVLGSRVAALGSRVAAMPGTEEYEASPPLPLLENPQQHLIIYVDNANIREINRKRIFKQLRGFLDSSWRSNLWVMLVTNDRSLNVRQDFTTDSGRVFRTLDEIAATTSAQPRLDTDRRNIERMIGEVNVEAGSGLLGTKSSGFGEQSTVTGLVVAEAQALLPLISSYSQERLGHVRNTLRVLDRFVTVAAGMPGRKSLLYVSDGLTLRPAEGLLEGYRRYFQILSDVGETVSPDAVASRDDATPDFRNLVTHANSSGVTFYTLDASPSASMSRGSAENAAGAGGNFGSWKDGIEYTEQYNRQDSLMMMAQGTGGRYGFTTAAIADVFQGMWTDFDNYYSLGYAADRLESGKKRDVKIKLRDGKGLTLRYRQSFRDRTTVERASERAQAALLVEGLDNPLGIVLEPRGKHQPQDKKTFVVQLLVKLELDKLILLPEETARRAQVSMYVAVRDEKGRTSGIRRHLCPISIPESEADAAEGKLAACGLRLLMRKGRQKVVVSVLDELAAVHSTASVVVDVGGVQNAAL